MNDVRELCLKPSSRSSLSPPLSMAFRDCGGAAFKMQRPLLGDNYAPPKRLPPPPPPLQSSPRRRWCREGGTGDCVGSWKRGRDGQRTIELAKIIKSFLLRRFPLFLSLLFARRMEGATENLSKLKAHACASNTCSVIRFPPSHHFSLCRLQSHRRLSQKSHASSRDSNSKVT